MAEWEAAVTKFTELTPHLHYGTSSCWRASHRATVHGKPWRIVVISTIENFYQWLNQEEPDGSKFRGPGIFHQVILDETHMLRMSGTRIGKFRKANGTFLKMDSRDYTMHMASCKLSLEPQYKWMLKATPVVNGSEDLRWMPHLLESPSWLTLQLPPDTFDYTHNIDDYWIATRSNVPGTERGAGFTPVADPYKKGPEFGSLVHCTTMACNAYMLPKICEVGKLTKDAQTSNILIRQHRYEVTIGKRAFAVLCALKLQRTMMSHIPFKNPKPIFNIPPLHVTTKLVTFTKSSGAGQFYIDLVDGRYTGLRERSTGVASTQATTMGNTKRFGPHWGCISLISVVLFLALPWWIRNYRGQHHPGPYLSRLMTWADQTWSCWWRLFLSLQKLSKGSRTEYLRLRSSTVWQIIRSMLRCGLRLESQLGSNTLSGTPWQRQTHERR